MLESPSSLKKKNVLISEPHSQGLSLNCAHAVRDVNHSVVLTLEHVIESHGGLFKTQIAGSHARVSDWVGLEAHKSAFLANS